MTESSPYGTPATSQPQTCALCATPLEASAERCPECGLYQQLGPDRPNPFRGNALWTLAGLVAAVYLVVLLIVLAVR